MTYQKEQHATFVEDGKPITFIRFDEKTRQRIIYICREADDEDLERLFNHAEISK